MCFDMAFSENISGVLKKHSAFFELIRIKVLPLYLELKGQISVTKNCILKRKYV